jgi:hypothetical protein
MNLWSPLKIWQSRLHDWTQIGFAVLKVRAPRGNQGAQGHSMKSNKGGLAAKPSISLFWKILVVVEYQSTGCIA